ncbi:MAG: T9SS type A sorting domain-containing protein [Bacteroidetes bacterium]|nr:T9SS type A sorting domain-containing protein [Bacteroidota bacterium]
MKKLVLGLVVSCLLVVSNLCAQIPQSGDIVTNTTTTAPRMAGGHGAYNIGPDIECNEDGRYTIAWVQDVSPSWPSFHKSYKRGYNDMGGALSGTQDVVHASPPTAYIGSGDPKIAMKPNGDYIIVYYEFASPIASTTSERIYFHKYFANGAPNGGRVFVDYGYYADIDIASDETFNISYKGRTTSNNSVAYVKRYSATGASAGPRITIDAAGTSHYETNVQSRNNNEFTVCYKPDGPYSNLTFKAYNSSGVNMSSNSMPGRFISKRNFIYKPNGDIVAVSVNNHYVATNPLYNMKNTISRFTPGGSVSDELGSEIIIAVSDYQIRYPTIEINTNGDYVVAFPKYENNQSLGIYLQQYNVNDQPVGPEYPVSTLDNSMIGVMLDVAECSFMVTWYNFNDEKIYHKRFKLYDEEFEITGDDSICEGETSILTATGGYTNYLWSDGVTTTDWISATTSGTYTVTAWNGTQDECSPTATFELTVHPSPIIDLPSTISMCTAFEELCGPLAPSGSTYNYQWYGTQYNPWPVSVLVGEEMCFTPSETGHYTLIVANENCTTSHTVLITDQLPQPDLGGDIIIPCGGDPISDINILNQGFDNPDYTITWYHDGQEIQVGGEALMSSFIDGQIRVIISYDGCESISDTILISQEEPCCPSDLELAFDCHTGELYVENLPSDITVETIFWELDGNTVPSETNTTLQVTAPGTYSFGIIFTLSNGVECHHFIHYTVSEDDCPNTIFCPDDLELAMNCETGTLYVENLPSDISISTIFWELNGDTIPSATDTTLQVTQVGTYSLGIIFTLSTGLECHHFIHFEYVEDYCCDITGGTVAIEFDSLPNYVDIIDDTPYGPIEFPVFCDTFRLSTNNFCEDEYYISVDVINPSDWTVGPNYYNGLHQGNTPSSINLFYAPYNMNLDPGQYYLITFAVNPGGATQYLVFGYQMPGCMGKAKIGISPNPFTDKITIDFGAKQYGRVEVLNMFGQVSKQEEFANKNTLDLNLGDLNSGVYFVKFYVGEEVYTKTIIKD